MSVRYLSVLMVTAAAATAAYGCVPELPGSTRKIESARYSVAYRTQPDKITVGQHFAVELAVCANPGAAAPESVRVDAHMPDHRHGMNYRTSVKPAAGGRYRAEGLMFHMPGRWEYIFELRVAGRTERLTQSEVIE